MSTRKKKELDHCLEMKEPVHLNHQQTDPPLYPGTQPANSGYDSDQADVAPQNSRTDPHRPGGPHSSGVVKHDPLPPPQGKFYHFVHNTQNAIYEFWAKHKKLIKRIVWVILLVLYFVYLGFAIHRHVEEAAGLIVATVIFCLYFVYKILFEKYWQKCRIPCCHMDWWRQSRTKARIITVLKWCSLLGLLGGIVVFLVVDVGNDPGRLTSGCGVLVFLLLGFLTSTNPARVDWRPVIWGLGLQAMLGVIILRWDKGYLAFKFMGEQVQRFLEFTDEGSKFVFGEEGFEMHPVAFKVFPIVIFFSSVISIMYYWGVMQLVVCRIAWLMQFTMGTTAIESLNAATNIFIGMAESTVVVAPYMNKLTKSEIHAIMTGGFATVAGSYMAVLIQVGASPEHLLSAAIMSAPAALAMAKLSYPETEVSCTRTEEEVYIPPCQERNVVEAAARGAIESTAVIASIAVNLIAFIALMAFLDSGLHYLGAKIGYPELSFQIICSYALWPLSAIMGVEIADAGAVAKLLGIKIFMDEFISFRDLAVLVKAGEIAERSAVIATYACCGFGSISAVGTYVGALSAVAPERRGDISEIAFRAAVNGNIAGFLTACIAGFLYKGDMTLMGLSGDIIHSALNETVISTASTVLR